MDNLKKVGVGGVILTLAGCGLLPTQNTGNKPVSITADGEQYYTCSAFSIDSESSWGGETTYELSFHDPTRGGGKVELKGVKKLEIAELPSMVNDRMPTYLPDLKNGLDRDGKPFQEGNIYSFSDGSEAQVKNGIWVAVKVPDKICEPVE